MAGRRASLTATARNNIATGPGRPSEQHPVLLGQDLGMAPSPTPPAMIGITM